VDGQVLCAIDLTSGSRSIEAGTISIILKGYGIDARDRLALGNFKQPAQKKKPFRGKGFLGD
jgi:hypothetical protein